MSDDRRRLLAQRWIAAAILVLAVPVAMVAGSVADEQPIVAGEPAPRTVIADETVRVEDVEGTERARRVAAETISPVTVRDSEARATAVAETRAVFAAARSARTPVEATTEVDPDDDDRPATVTPSVAQQADAIVDAVPAVDQETAAAIVGLDDGALDDVERETVAVVQVLARQPVDEDSLGDFLDEELGLELSIRSFPGDTSQTVAEPVVRAVMRPTVVVDLDQTEAARQRAADEVGEVANVWDVGDAIVTQGQMVDAVALRGVEQLGLEGSSPLRALLRGGVGALLLVAIAAVYLARMHPRVWDSGKKLLLLSGLVTVFSGLLVVAGAVSDIAGSAWAYTVPAGALAMLVALLIHPGVGLAMTLPAVAVVLLVDPTNGPVALFAAATVLVSVPLTTRIAARSDLRSATLRAALSYPLLAAATVAMLGPRDELWAAIGAAAANGLITALVVQGALPFLENLFRLPTVTALLDLSDRNHPLLRELETTALGTYNHSVMVASLTERACRAVGADPLLGTVAALYHDIGKVRQPHFFIENQQGIANPHDDLDPAVSAQIIQAHVADGVAMADEHKLPPEVITAISSHHGNMLVSFFYDAAVKLAGGADRVEESRFRYPGPRPRSKEAALLLFADCCEATTRAMAMSRGTLPRDEIEATVDRLLAERVDDGQFDDSDLTFRELKLAREAIVEALVGIYHPRIAYPAKPGPAVVPDTADAADATPTPIAAATGQAGSSPSAKPSSSRRGA